MSLTDFSPSASGKPLFSAPLGDLSTLAREREEQADKRFGFWLYLMSDAIIFSLLMVSYILLSTHTAGGPQPKQLFDLDRVMVETAFLLISSITFGFASVALNQHNRKMTLVWLAVTGVFGLCFLGMELQEFSDIIHAGAGPSRSAFLSAFFTLVGTHGGHVTVGLIWIVIMMIQIGLFGLTGPVFSRMGRLAIFWHFLDIIWIGVFSIVYLCGVLS